jgi:SAM-dependent methyltransferase
MQRSRSGKEYYRLLYRSELDAEAEWLRRGAVEKANSIEQLLRRHAVRPDRILEIGCGTGAVLEECRRRGIGSRYTALDYSEEALSYLRSRLTGIETITADVTCEDFSFPGKYDVVIASHVLEHLETPGAFLQSILGRLDFAYLIVEVPLEDLFAFRVKALLRDRRRNEAGHVQFFTASRLRRLVTTSGLEIIGQRRYVPVLDWDTIRLIGKKDRKSAMRCLVKAIGSHYLARLLRPLWARLYYAHYAVLCRRPTRPEVAWHCVGTAR